MSQYLPKVAVLMAAYNGRNWVAEQARSILKQNKVEVTLFISVDRSTDDTYEWCSRLSEKNPQVECLPYGERFGSVAGNFFRLIREVDFSQFDFVSLSDQDDLWMADKLSRAVSALQQHGADFVSSNVVAFWEDGREKLIVKNQKIGPWNHLFESAGPGCTFVFKSEVASVVADFLGANKNKIKHVALHDWFLFAWAVSHGYVWHIDDYPGVRYRQHGSNEVGINFGLRAAKMRWNRLIGGWYRNQTLLLADLVGQADAPPIRRLRRFGMFDRILLIATVHNYRRTWRDRIALALTLMLMTFKSSTIAE